MSHNGYTNKHDVEEFLEPSDEEVLAYSSPSEDDDQDDDQASEDDGDDDDADGDRTKGEDEDDVGGWGSSKKDYYDADVIETEQDALDEEEEALRIQKKQLQGMTAADYGFDESEWQEGNAEDRDEDAEDDGAVVTEILPQIEITEKMGTAERLKILKSRYPEFEPLSKELLDLQRSYKELGTTSDPLKLVLATKQQAAAAYLASLTMYFALLTSTADDSQSNGVAFSATALRDHPIMDSLIQCRDLWARVKDLPEDEMVEDIQSEISEEEVSDIEMAPESAVVAKKSKPTKSRAQRAADATAREAAVRRAERLRKTEQDLAQLDVLANPEARSKSRKAQSKPDTVMADGDDSDFGEETELNAHDLAEKAKRKKSLRFYTSQIAQKANKRGVAGRNAGGDDDIPHRERLRDRQARLNAEAEAKGKKQNGRRDELGEDSDEEDRRQARELRNDVDNDDEYYDMVAAKSSKKKSDKKALADAHKEAALQGGRVIEKEELGPDGKRAISYTIEKNKGLTPHRKKDVRNPRVKKRKKYDEKKKKLASMKPVYKGGEGRGGYGGELTGIKKGLVRSTKL